MSRGPVSFGCEGSRLAATLDDAPGGAGLLLVSGGNEIRSGAWAGQAQLAARLAGEGHPVFRFDRRGVGDSEGANRGFRHSGEDIAAARAAFREAAPHLRRVVAFGNCDAATALALFGHGLAADALVLANPWVLDDDRAELQAPTAIRARYKEKLSDPNEWRRMLSGQVNFRKLAMGLRQATGRAPASGLAAEMRDGLGRFPGPVEILLAERDRTARWFAEAWGDDPRIARSPTASHSFSEPAAREWLVERLLAMLRGSGSSTSS